MRRDILVTGSEGYIGSNIFDFYGGTRRFDKLLGNDIMNKDELAKAMHGCHIVFNCAAVSGIVKCRQNAQYAYQVNVEGSRNVVEVAEKKQVKPVLFSSQAAIRGDSYYGKLKRQMETLFENRAVILRMSNVYGGLKYDTKRNALWHFSHDNPIIVNGAGQTRDFIYISDVLKKWCYRAHTMRFGIYDVKSDLEIPVLTIARMFAATRNVPLQIVSEDSSTQVCTLCGAPNDCGITLHGKFVCVDCTTACSIVNKCGQMEVAQNR